MAALEATQDRGWRRSDDAMQTSLPHTFCARVRGVVLGPDVVHVTEYVFLAVLFVEDAFELLQGLWESTESLRMG